MRIILMKDMKGLGVVGDELQVKDGYARNYLIPQSVALEATPGAVRTLEQKKLKRVREELKLKEECGVIAEKIKNTSCTISMETGEEEKLFGAVTSDMIAESLLAEGIEVDKKKVELEEPIKALGVYNIDIKLHPEVKAQLRLWVVKK